MEKIEVVKPGAVINIPIGDAYYKDLQDLVVFFSKTVPPEELALQIDHIRQDKPLSEWGVHFKTLLTLINEIENRAREQQLTMWMDIPVPGE
jgi:hypothetical protein